MSKNDDKIIELKKRIEQTKQALIVPAKFQPQTTCMITIDGERMNLNTINNVKKLNYIMVKLHMFKLAADDLKIAVDDYELDGFTYSQWITDIQRKKEIITYNEKLKELNTLENTLEKLLSEDKKVELELDKIAKMLG